MISHHLLSARKGDRIVVVEKGQITGCGTHAELMAEGSGNSWYQTNYLKEQARINGDLSSS